MSDLYSLVNGKLSVHLHPGQTAAWESKKRFVFMVCGTQSGKTSFMPIYLDRMIREAGEGDYLCATATYDILRLKFLPELQNYFVHMFGWNYSASEKTIWKGKTRIICRSADAEGGLESASAKGAIFDECGMDSVKVNAWEAILRRLSLSQGRVLAGTTPYNLGWLKTQIFDKWRAGDPDIQVVQFKSIMNPSFPVAEYERARRTLPAWKFEMFYNGELRTLRKATSCPPSQSRWNGRAIWAWTSARCIRLQSTLRLTQRLDCATCTGRRWTGIKPQSSTWRQYGGIMSTIYRSLAGQSQSHNNDGIGAGRAWL
jgi:hypothetical protein